jgi:hypothetical protein
MALCFLIMEILEAAELRELSNLLRSGTMGTVVAGEMVRIALLEVKIASCAQMHIYVCGLILES